MLILSLRTDNPESELGLYENDQQKNYLKWTAHRQLAESIHQKIVELLTQSHNELDDIKAIVCFRGPGSFTGLRIGLSVANAMSYSLKIPIVGAEGGNWQADAIAKILKNINDKQVTPLYGNDPYITKQTK
jgi:tRNA threonylcarbamoyladenosine biosynthesis protein TsaB